MEKFSTTYDGMLYSEKLIDDGIFTKIEKDEGNQLMPFGVTVEFDT